LSMSPLH